VNGYKHNCVFIHFKKKIPTFYTSRSNLFINKLGQIQEQIREARNKSIDLEILNNKNSLVNLVYKLAWYLIYFFLF